MTEEISNKNKALAWEKVETKHLVKDKWIDFRKVKYRFPDGQEFEPFYTYSRRNYVVIVAEDEEGNYLCVRQFRQGIEQVTVEFPAGGIESGKENDYGSKPGEDHAEDALEAAKRELREETGYISNDWKHLITVPSNATIADNYAYIYMARGCRKASDLDLDETEFLEPERYSKSQIEEMIADGEFPQAVHIMAWLLAQRSME